jgi:TrmH family RNA methyltransferase
VIAAAKGSFLRVQLYYQDLLPVLQQSSMPVYGAYLEGQSVHQLTLSRAGGYLVMGNEANGISTALKPVISHPITIPGFSDTESLNVGIATAVLCDNLKRLSAS